MEQESDTYNAGSSPRTLSHSTYHGTYAVAIPGNGTRPDLGCVLVFVCCLVVFQEQSTSTSVVVKLPYLQHSITVPDDATKREVSLLASPVI